MATDYEYHRMLTQQELSYILRRLMINDMGKDASNEQTAQWFINERWKRYGFDWKEIK